MAVPAMDCPTLPVTEKKHQGGMLFPCFSHRDFAKEKTYPIKAEARATEPAGMAWI